MRKRYDFDQNKVIDLTHFGLRTIPSQVHSDVRGEHKILEVFDSYSEAVNRMHRLAIFSPCLIYPSRDDGVRPVRAGYGQTQRVEFTRTAKHKKDADIARRRMPIDHREPEPTPRQSSRVRKEIPIAMPNVLERASFEMTDGLSAIMPSMIVLAWTAFETLCQDLLETAIDLRQQWLLPVRGTSRLLRGRSTLRSLPSYEGMTLGRQIQTPSKTSQGYQSRDQLRYTTVTLIRDAYYKTFFADARKIDAALRSRHIDTLSAVRNVIVHKGGYVDRTFLNRVSGLPEFANAKEGHLLRMDFEKVRRWIEPVMVSGAKLIVAVNKWIVEHPDAIAPP